MFFLCILTEGKNLILSIFVFGVFVDMDYVQVEDKKKLF